MPRGFNVDYEELYREPRDFSFMSDHDLRSLTVNIESMLNRRISVYTRRELNHQLADARRERDIRLQAESRIQRREQQEYWDNYDFSTYTDGMLRNVTRRTDPSELKYIRTLSNEELQRRIDSPQTTYSFTPRRKEMYANELKRRAHQDKLRRRDFNMDYSDSTDRELENVLSGYKRRLCKAYDQKHFNWINTRIEAVEKELERRQQTSYWADYDFSTYTDNMLQQVRDRSSNPLEREAFAEELHRRRRTAMWRRIEIPARYPILSTISYTCSPNGTGGGRASFRAVLEPGLTGEIDRILGTIDGLTVTFSREENATTSKIEFSIPRGQLGRFIDELQKENQ